MKAQLAQLVEPQTFPLFDVKETENSYVMAIDLPDTPIPPTGIEARGNELNIFMDPNDPKNIWHSKTLFHCQSMGHGVRAYYQNGMLWLVLPKKSAETEAPHHA